MSDKLVVTGIMPPTGRPVFCRRFDIRSNQ
jgi:hypothetical protein